jgi:predicted 3-demethylubiquinone-9 3-methyltransferase (glyoxalase superfamily)
MAAILRPASLKESQIMARSVSTHLMFDGTAEQAMQLYVSVLAGSAIKHIERYGAGEMGAEGSVKMALFSLGGRDFICIDTPVKHAFTFTPSMSIFVECESEEELDSIFAQLAAGGKELMPLNNYGFSRRFGWLQDRFGVSWQLNLA